MKKENRLKISRLYGNGRASKKITDYLEKIPINQDLIEKQITY